MKFLKRIFIGLLVLIALLSIALYFFMQQKTFGKHPTGERLKRIEQSPNYRDGSFQNLSPTEMILKEASFWQMTKEWMSPPTNVAPSKPLPSVQTNLKNITDTMPTLVWFGHSSVLITYKGTRILLDPIFSGHASPLSFSVKSFAGSDVYSVADMPDVDVLIITHDHYDHLDYETITQIKEKVKRFVVPLGIGEHLEHWGVESARITELDWWEQAQISDSVNIRATPARHFSGRGFKRGKTLWASYVVSLHGYKIFLSGDSGYDKHYADIGNKYGPFDIALIECGQYGKNWPYIHHAPEQVAQAATDLHTKALLPIHWAKFQLALHPWNEPVMRLLKSHTDTSYVITTPRIGEPVVLGTTLPQQQWWNF